MRARVDALGGGVARAADRRGARRAGGARRHAPARVSTPTRSLASAYEAVIYHLQFTYDESFAVLNGRSPLGDFAAQYASLWPYVLGAADVAARQVGAVFTVLMAALTGLALLALFDVLRRVTRSSLAALLLFLPLLATSALRLHGPLDDRFSLDQLLRHVAAALRRPLPARAG